MRVERRSRDFAASEDAVQEALIAAADQWPQGGVPDHPLGWLIHVALRRLTDYARSDIARRHRENVVADDAPAVVVPAVDGEPAIDPDDGAVERELVGLVPLMSSYGEAHAADHDPRSVEKPRPPAYGSREPGERWWSSKRKNGRAGPRPPVSQVHEPRPW